MINSSLKCSLLSERKKRFEGTRFSLLTGFYSTKEIKEFETAILQDAPRKIKRPANPFS